jgi:hypothetical protein
MIPNDLFLILNIRPRLNDSIMVGNGQIVQVIQVIIYPRWALLMIPHEYGEETGLRRLRLSFRLDDLQRLKGLLFENRHLQVFFLLLNNQLGGRQQMA